MVHKMKLQGGPFQAIKSKNKDIEMRLFDEKRQKIKIGDIIEFENAETGEELTVRVVELHIFDSFEGLYESFEKKRLGYKENEIANPSDMEKYYPVCEILQFGVVGIEIRLI